MLSMLGSSLPAKNKEQINNHRAKDHEKNAFRDGLHVNAEMAVSALVVVEFWKQVTRSWLVRRKSNCPTTTHDVDEGACTDHILLSRRSKTSNPHSLFRKICMYGS